jgi:hypothetical protein
MYYENGAELLHARRVFFAHSMDFLRDFSRLSRTKLLLTLLLGVCAGILSRVCPPSDTTSVCECAALFTPLAPLAHQLRESAATAFLARSGRVAERALDIGALFLLLCLLMIRSNRPAPLSRTYVLKMVVAALTVALIAVVRFRPPGSDAALLSTTWYVLDTATALYDLVLLASMLLFAAPLLPEIRSRRTPVLNACATLATLMILAQITGMLYRYTGMRFAPTPPFALLLGAAYLIAPLQLFLLFITTCHVALNRPAAERLPAGSIFAPSKPTA